MKKLTLVVLFLLSAASTYGETLTLNGRIIVSAAAVPAGAFFAGAVPWSFTVNVGYSRFLANDEIVRILAAQGIRDAEVIGRGVDVIVAQPGDVRGAIYDRVRRIYPGIGTNFDLPPLTRDAALHDLDAYYTNGTVALRLGLILFRDGVGYLTNVYHVAKVAPDTDSTNAAASGGGDMLIVAMDGQDATVEYRSGGVVVRIKTKVVRNLGGGRYLVENPQTHRQFEAVMRQ